VADPPGLSAAVHDQFAARPRPAVTDLIRPQAARIGHGRTRRHAL